MQRLCRDWQHRPAYVLLDLDFGTGQRLAETVDALLSDPLAPACLHYVAIVPQLPGASTVAGAATPTSAPWRTQLHRAWPPAVNGFHRLMLADGRVWLTLVVGEVTANLPQLELTYDLAFWRMDGGSGENANRVRQSRQTTALWLGRLAGKDALLCLTTRRQAADGHHFEDAANAEDATALLAGHGFTGRGNGTDAVPVAAPADAGRIFRYASQAPVHHSARPAPLPGPGAGCIEKHAIVIGAGVAGAAACHRLVQRGWRCTLIERLPAPAQLASGNPAGIYMPALSRDDNTLSRLSRAAYLFALRIWDSAGGIGQAFPGAACGLLQLARSDARSHPGAASPLTHPYNAYPSGFVRWMDSTEASAAAGQTIAGGWWFARAGWVHPPAVCRALLDACGDRLLRRFGQDAATLLRDANGIWHVCDSAGGTIASAPTVIVACGVQAGALAQTAQLPLSAIRGQITALPAAGASLPFAIVGDAYLTPVTAQASGHATLGATYDRNDSDTMLRADSHRENINHLRSMLPDWTPPASEADIAALAGRVGFRSVAPDRLPLAGAVPGVLPDPAPPAAATDGHPVRQPGTRLRDMPRLPGLYCLLGYGSRGLIWAPLMAELLASQLNGEPSPLPRDLVAAVDPARFALKQRRHDIDTATAG